MRRWLPALFALALVGCAANPKVEYAAMPRTYAHGIGGATFLVGGGFDPGRSPDGNSLILYGPEGAFVIDTGRHAEHLTAIKQGLSGIGMTPVAIINTHWHLDHVSGNPELKAAFPDIKVYGTSAIDGALAGFLAKSAESSRKALAEGSIPPSAIAEVEGDLATIARGAELRPDVIVDESRDLAIAGRPLSLRVAPHAVTERDLWIYDAAEKRAIVGDLVTVPVPFLDTACPEGWLNALDAVAASGAEQIVPGHGPIMAIADFNRWRVAFGDFIACANGTGALETCSAGWLAGAAKWIGSDTARAKAMADYYGELVRSKKLDGYCKV
ncbi:MULTISPECIES: MBL fold metallo-hydrolase [unclassified Sphingopyxis]|jgi:glyoxylase-like metal-dependent hydrolase (beta-lactamase superfamily II)|uniref:MBL fold metallo-hydrolase n=1 Tax=unclassified Sphingopyxis TaxID=2614943 RepID=UPI0006C7114F|nr:MULTISPECIES: MBL fold metallo-hydrolase [unclassified Sphingopyxis]USI77538.1 MBL fold metallo-hydrolase [Sphingopyxis sp. USTB-05]GAO79974.1 Zn-dependent hydrolases, including glyoxylases [Sphingopyxis sp. C-1]